MAPSPLRTRPWPRLSDEAGRIRHRAGCWLARRGGAVGELNPLFYNYYEAPTVG